MFVFNEDTAIEDLGNGVKRKVLAHAWWQYDGSRGPFL